MFDQLVQLPEDPIYSLPKRFLDCPHPKKINMGIGIYLNEEGLSTPFKAVQEAEKISVGQSLDYLPIEGDREFIALAKELVFGEKIDEVDAVQTVGGTGALYLAASLLRAIGKTQFYITNPTWPNHLFILESQGFKLEWLPYYDEDKKRLNFVEFIKKLSLADKGSPVLLHLSCHNPTGIDPSSLEWDKLLEVCYERELIPLFDNAYQGYSKPYNEDIIPLKKWIALKRPFFSSTSFAKNFGLYGERAGMLLFSTSRNTQVMSHLKKYIRTHYSTPPKRGALLIKTILKKPELFKLWKEELEARRLRLIGIRKEFAEKLGKPFDFIKDEHGLFSYLELTKEQFVKLEKEKGLIMLQPGRINVSSLNKNNIDYAVSALLSL